MLGAGGRRFLSSKLDVGQGQLDRATDEVSVLSSLLFVSRISRFRDKEESRQKNPLRFFPPRFPPPPPFSWAGAGDPISGRGKVSTGKVQRCSSGLTFFGRTEEKEEEEGIISFLSRSVSPPLYPGFFSFFRQRQTRPFHFHALERTYGRSREKSFPRFSLRDRKGMTNVSCKRPTRTGGGKEGEELGFLNDPELKSSPPQPLQPKRRAAAACSTFFLL